MDIGSRRQVPRKRPLAKLGSIAQGDERASTRRLGTRMRPITARSARNPSLLAMGGAWATSARKAEPEPGSALTRLRADTAATPFHELLHDREADAGAAARSVARFLDAVEPLEHAIEVL